MDRKTIKVIRDLESGDEFTVDVWLSAQFLAKHNETGKAKYFMYKDKNVSWEVLE